MFVLALALFAAPVALPAAEPQRARSHKTTKRTTKRPARRTRARIANIRPILPPCSAGSVLTRCAKPDRNAQYRLGYTPTEQVDVKARALQGPFRNCGITGMPVCPSKGQTIIQTGE